MKNISLGRYLPTNSFMHKADPRIKFFGLIIFMVLIFLKFATPWTDFLMYGIYALVIFIIMKVAKLRVFSIFKQLKSLWFMMIFLLVINLFTFQRSGGNTLFMIGNFAVKDIALYQTLYILIRLVLMIALTSILTASTKPLDLTYAIEWYMSPLKVIRFPVHEIAMTLSIALRFIPTLLDETGRIMRAQESRGVDFKGGRVKEKIRAIVALIVPLFVSALQRSDELANAMIARGYDPQAKRTRYRLLYFSWRDVIVLCLSLGFLTGVILLRVYKIDLADMLYVNIQNLLQMWGLK
ncbi:MAG: Energy-coupling factor transporter transmembrane protein EcfT [Tenericutes bacterium ADurb.Bin239]|nr:MAG: Energy-coupling factor transporter transmembrane protein EcfT [Tenericutes bacterium ADurb.Bin239]